MHDVKVILISYWWQTLDPEMIRFVELDCLAEKTVVVKSTLHYRAAFEPIAKEIIEVMRPTSRRPTSSASASGVSAARSSRLIPR